MTLQNALIDIFLMKTDSKLTVADAKDAYFRWNAIQHDRLVTESISDVGKYIELIPLFLQLNNKLLPGYVGPDVPVGVYSYKPDKNIINQAKSLNNKFRYQQEGVIKNFAFDSVMYQKSLIDNKNICWIFYRSSLNKNQIEFVKEKINKLDKWFSLRGSEIDFLCLSDADFRSGKFEDSLKTIKSIFIDYFYSEVSLLAGKYPVWWLVPPSKESEYAAFVEHIKQARFVDNDEFIDLGSAAELTREDIIYDAVELVQKIKQAPEICLVKLLIADQKNSSWPEHNGISTRLKKNIYDGDVQVSPIDVVAQIMRDVLGHYAVSKHVLSPRRLFSQLKAMPGDLNVNIVDAFLDEDYVNELSVTGLDSIIMYLNFFKALTYKISQIFSNIITLYNAEKNIDDVDPSLKIITDNMLVFLSDNADRVPLYNNKDKVDIIFDRILLKHEVVNEEDRWSLVLGVADGNEKTIEGFSSLLGVLAWCWFNRVVNNSTQVSIDCPKQQVKQIEARYVLETLIQQLNPELLSAIPAEAFENPVRPLQSLLFVNFMSISKKDFADVTKTDDPLSFAHESRNLVTHCEQLIINSWGDVHTRQYSSTTGVLRCLCDWTHHAPLDSLSRPQPLKIFGHGVGDSTYMAQRVEQVYEEMQSFFYNNQPDNGRFVLRIGSDYHVVIVEDSILMPYKIGSQHALIEYLEAATKDFHNTAFERLAFTEYPLREIYQNNKQNTLQVFFQVINQSFYSWVLDEKGSLWSDTFSAYNRESYIMHWLYFFRNIRNRLKKINYQERELPSLEMHQVSYNQLGGIDFFTIGSDAITGSKKFIDIKVSIDGHEGGDRLSLVCDGRQFNYQDFQQSVLVECVQYLSTRMITEGRLPVYVTDIDVPLRVFNVIERDDIQISHMLKFKRNFEHRLNKLLDEK